MWAVKFYVFTWIFLLAVAGILSASGLFNPMLKTSFDFIFATLFFAGIVAVLPLWMDEHYSRKIKLNSLEKRPKNFK